MENEGFEQYRLSGLAADSATNLTLLASVLLNLDFNNVRFAAFYWK